VVDAHQNRRIELSDVKLSKQARLQSWEHSWRRGERRPVCPVLKCYASFAPADRVTAESNFQRLTRSVEFSCDYNNKKDDTSVSAAGLSSRSLLFCEKPVPRA